MRAIAWSPDSKRIAVVGGESGRGAEGCVIAFDTGSAIGTLAGHAKPITSVAYRPVAPFRVITGSEDTSVVFHEGPPFKFLRSCKEVHSNFVNAVAFSTDGAFAFSCGSDGIVGIYNGLTGDPVSQLTPKLPCSLWGMGVVNSAGTVALACGDKKVRLIDINNAIVGEAPVGNGELKDMPLGIAGDHKTGQIRTVSLDGNIRLYSSAEGLSLTGTMNGSQGGITAIHGLSTGVVVGGSDGSVWTIPHPLGSSEIQRIPCKKPLKGSAGLVVYNDKVLGILADSGSLVDVTTAQEPVGISNAPASTTRLVSCNKTAGYALGDKDCYLSKLDNSGPRIPSGIETVQCFGVSGDGSTVAVVYEKQRGSTVALQSENREIIIFTTGSPKIVVKTEFVTADIVSVAVAGDGSLVAAASAAQELHVYKLSPSGAYEVVNPTPRCWTYHKGRIASMMWIDDRFLLTGSLDKAVYLWDVEKVVSGPCVSLKECHREGVSQVYGIRDGEKVSIVSGGNDGCVKVNQVVIKI